MSRHAHFAEGQTGLEHAQYVIMGLKIFLKLRMLVVIAVNLLKDSSQEEDCSHRQPWWLNGFFKGSS